MTHLTLSYVISILTLSIHLIIRMLSRLSPDIHHVSNVSCRRRRWTRRGCRCRQRSSHEITSCLRLSGFSPRRQYVARSGRWKSAENVSSSTCPASSCYSLCLVEQLQSSPGQPVLGKMSLNKRKLFVDFTTFNCRRLMLPVCKQILVPKLTHLPAHLC